MWYFKIKYMSGVAYLDLIKGKHRSNGIAKTNQQNKIHSILTRSMDRM